MKPRYWDSLNYTQKARYEKLAEQPCVAANELRYRRHLLLDECFRLERERKRCQAEAAELMAQISIAEEQHRKQIEESFAKTVRKELVA